MRNILFLIYLISTTISSAQEKVLLNIFTQSIFSNSKEIYTNSDGNIIFFDNVYSHNKLNLGSYEINDSINLSGLSNQVKNYKYILESVYIKDSIEGMFIIKNYALHNKLPAHSYKSLSFKRFNNKLNTFTCNDKLYNDLALVKDFGDTAAIVSANDDREIFFIKLLDNECNVISQEKYLKRYLLYCDTKDYVVFNYKNYFIFIYTN